jgi:ferredoxin
MKKFSLMDRLRIPTYDNIKHMQTGDLIFDAMKCRQCGICIRVCPGGCLVTDSVTKIDIINDKKNGVKSGVPRVDSLKSGVTLCIACYDCGAACPYNAISIKKNFDPKYFYKRLNQAPEMRYPKNY